MNFRKHGKAPFSVVVVHGGPGAAGEMRPVAQRLASKHGILEPLQTELSIEGQCRELREVLESIGDWPYVLIGHSWGAMLSYIFTAKHAEMVSKLILVSSAVFQESYATTIMETRLKRCTFAERELFERLDRSTDKESTFLQLGKLITRIDAFNTLPEEETTIDASYEIYKRVWEEAREFRKSGELVNLGKLIRCPVVAIHGDYDPHPAEGVREPLCAVLDDFRFFLLSRCGHTPWNEIEAKEEFFTLIEKELE